MSDENRRQLYIESIEKAFEELESTGFYSDAMLTALMKNAINNYDAANNLVKSDSTNMEQFITDEMITPPELNTNDDTNSRMFM